MEKISVITVVYNDVSHIRQTIDSFLCQTWSEKELIVIDGGSTDGTADVLKRYDSDIELINREPTGVYDAINAGFSNADGDVVGMLHAGDTFTDDEVLKRVGEAFEADPDLDFLFGDVHFAPEGGPTLRYYSGKAGSLESVINGFAPPHPSLYVRGRLIASKGLYKADYRLSADFEMFCRLFSDSSLKWRYLPLDMVCMSPGGLSSKLSSRLWVHNVERLRALRQNGLPASLFNISKHYLQVLKSFIYKNG